MVEQWWFLERRWWRMEGVSGGWPARGEFCEKRVENRRFCIAVFVEKKSEGTKILC